MTHHREYGKTYDIVADQFTVNSYDISPTILDLSLTNAVGSARTEVGEAGKLHFEKVGNFVTMTFVPTGLAINLNAANSALMTFNEVVPLIFRPAGLVSPSAVILNRVNAVNNIACPFTVNIPGFTIQIGATAGVAFVAGQSCACQSSVVTAWSTV